MLHQSFNLRVECPNQMMILIEDGPGWFFDAGERGFPLSFEIGERGQSNQVDGGPGWHFCGPPDGWGNLIVGPPEGCGGIVLH
ncbi:hypothetical protein BRE01_46230 [Brevibacillus reuszeri]|uniref:Uncharacterized protein n=2 Tax=Brevibacillus reuszeri TaxID=54915 RepID=A0A0K9YMT1_9BACL|nr:hypothetical protein ADS79_26715 [Brevibacillus reuszeri]GED70921.1 hypothetical protein BRE01_46230 [Brevibacillus reuszeri]